MSGSLGSRLRGLWKRRYYLWSRISRPRVPVHTLSWLPSGFSLTPLQNTGVIIAEGFGSAAELARSADPGTERALLYRAAMLSGRSDGFLNQSAALRLTTAEPVFSFPRAAGYCVCIFADAGAELEISTDRQISITGAPGRAVGWPAAGTATVRVIDGDAPATVHVFIYGAIRSMADTPVDAPRQVRTGQPLTGSESLPEGVWAPGADHLEAVFGKPDFLTKLIND
jgi:hypothetical protein